MHVVVFISVPVPVFVFVFVAWALFMLVGRHRVSRPVEVLVLGMLVLGDLEMLNRHRRCFSHTAVCNGFVFVAVFTLALIVLVLFFFFIAVIAMSLEDRVRGLCHADPQRRGKLACTWWQMELYARGLDRGTRDGQCEAKRRQQDGKGFGGSTPS